MKNLLIAMIVLVITMVMADTVLAGRYHTRGRVTKFFSGVRR